MKLFILICVCLFPLLVWISVEWFAAVLAQMFVEPDFFADCMSSGQISEYRAAMDACLINSGGHIAGNCDTQCNFNGLAARLR
ncbi:hypothetical protein [Chromobacterium amazonense]|uniref:Uncharacterized protein n=1 Tax=Chromobacterium amazonense TaxID=1382803 RepID=A0ABU8V241_9NEIS|nr:hypothetical protein [Chromobacterium amazonense]MDQ4540691.1 hypothetical protein [Chromobacterium amazonense]